MSCETIKAADNDETERPPRRSIGAVPSERNRAHQRGQRRHDDRAETFDARFVNRVAQVVAFIESMEGEVDDHDAVLLSRCP
jgi:hypothetical protein